MTEREYVYLRVPLEGVKPDCISIQFLTQPFLKGGYASHTISKHDDAPYNFTDAVEELVRFADLAAYRLDPGSPLSRDLERALNKFREATNV